MEISQQGSGVKLQVGPLGVKPRKAGARAWASEANEILQVLEVKYNANLNVEFQHKAHNASLNECCALVHSCYIQLSQALTNKVLLFTNSISLRHLFSIPSTPLTISSILQATHS
jgi:hypothetical protein